jgi:molecular chaperone GrpE
VAEPKREEDKILSFDENRDVRGPGNVSTASDDPTSADPSSAGYAAVVTELQKLRAEKEDLMQTLVRRQADFENFRKRTERDRSEEARRGVERVVTDLIPVLDAFDLALRGHDDPAYEEYRKGVTLIRKQLWDVLARHGVQRIESAGKMFDPHMHQAIERIESTELADGSIVNVLQDGYLFHGRVLRPAIVRVAVHPDDATFDRESN